MAITLHGMKLYIISFIVKQIMFDFFSHFTAFRAAYTENAFYEADRRKANVQPA